MVNQMPRPPLLSPGCAPGTYSLIIFTLVCVYKTEWGAVGTEARLALAGIFC